MKALLSVFVLLALSLPAAAENWCQFRGPTGMGHYAGAALPTEWGPKNVLWRTELKGDGHSSPVNWEHRIFLTTANDQGQSRTVLAIDARSGKLLWQKEISCPEPGKTHKLNSFATPSCATDGQRVVAFLDRAGMYAFDLEGKPLWKQSLGELPGPWGFAASPIFAGELVIQNCDTQGESFLVALDKQTGKIAWRTPRGDKPMGGWSTPILIQAGGRSELVLNGETGLEAYDPAGGKPLWNCKGFNGRGEPAPVFAHGLICTLNGKSGDIYAVRPGGSGDVSQTQRAWQTPRARIRDIASPLVVGEFLLAVDMKGSAAMYEARTGQQLWSDKIPGAFTSSPLESGGLIYVTSEAGETVVLRPGPKLDIVARNSLGDRDGELFRASPAAIDGRFYLRSNRALYCVGAK